MISTQQPAQEVIDEFVGVAHGDFDRVKELLAQYPDLVNANATWNETAIEAAAQMGRRDIVEHLLAAGAPLDICTAAVLDMDAHVAEFLDADPGQAQATGAHGIPLIYYPAIRGNVELAGLVLSRGADVNAGEGGNTALHGAAMFGQTEMARWLLAHGANPQAPNYEGKTPLEVAIAAGHQDLAEALRGQTA